jgi:cation-transporting ATPase 13A1
MCSLQHLETGRIFFKFQKLEYIYDEVEKRFKELQYPLELSIGEYISSKGFETADQLELSYDRFGYNLLDIPLPKFIELFKEHATAPFFVFQVFCVILWMLDEYWMYSLFTLCMFVIFEGLLVLRRIKSLQDVRNMRARPHQINVFRLGKWESILSTHLLPGDIVSIARSEENCVVPADLLLLYGSCVVNESLLTGESVPQIKEPVSNSDVNEKLAMHSTHKSSIIFGGTKVELHSYGKGKVKAAPDGGAIAYVLRTGFATNQGNLIRTILFATERVTVNNAESFLFILVLLVFAILASGYVLYYGLQDETRSRYKLLLNCIMIITSVVPPELPMELSLAVNNSLAELMKKKIFCTEPFRIPFAGGVQICCFDKTGTLTCDDFILKGIAGAGDDSKDNIEPVENISSNEAKYVIGGCHSLVKIGDQVVGDPLEKIAFQNLKWNLVGERTVKSGNYREEVNILHRYPFSSTLKRMTCVITVKDQSQETSYVVSKGAPEVIEKLLRVVPADFKATYMKYSMQGCRVLAMSFKSLGSEKLPTEDIRKKNRSEIEDGQTFCGFLILESPLKPESLKTIQELNESSHRIVMITGDHVLTACEVARLLEITSNPTLVLQPVVGHGLEWQSLDGSKTTPFDISKAASLSDSNDLCVSGDALEVLIRQHGGNELNRVCQSFICLVKVFARVSPKHKEIILTSMKALGFTALMCGDGTNDVGALKQAHVGVALIEGLSDDKRSAHRPGQTRKTPQQQMASNAKRDQKIQALENSSINGDTVDAKLAARQQQMDELMKALEESDVPMVQLGDASIAAPFTSKVANISCCADILRQGRCTLVATLQMYKILALNCLITAYSMSVLYLDGVKLGDTQATCFGIVMAAMYLGLSQSKSVNKLSKQRPHDSVFSWYMLLSIGGQFAVHLTAMIIAQGWAHPFTPT